MIEQTAATSIMGRAIKNGYISLDVINIRDFSANRHGHVDDYPYGGGAGMVLEAEPVFNAVQEAKKRTSKSARVIYLTPQAEVFTQTKAEELAFEESLILLCGHYEGIDERVLSEVVTDYVSIGDYVLTGGELPALVLMDAISRFVPGVLSNDESSQFESHQDSLLEYPHYTRPEVWHDMRVPEVLLSGDHKKISEWRHEESVKRTRERRPDLLKKSFAVKIFVSGNEKTHENAETFAKEISRYPEVFDYGRPKLQKTKTRLGAGDLAVFFFEGGDFETVFRNLSGDNTPAVFIGESASENAVFLKAAGFSVIGIFCSDDINESAGRVSLKIRKAAGEFINEDSTENGVMI